jgi:hypothetical protein
MSSLSNTLLPVVLMLLCGLVLRSLRPMPRRGRVRVAVPTHGRRRRTGWGTWKS